jgi:hypothetical protein
MHVDAREFTSSTSVTSEGAARNAKQFWKLWAEKYPETLAPSNLADIRKGVSPMVDDVWIKHFPEHQRFLGETLEHHHLNHGNITVALPETVHRRRMGYSIWHDTKMAEGKK